MGGQGWQGCTKESAAGGTVDWLAGWLATRPLLHPAGLTASPLPPPPLLSSPLAVAALELELELFCFDQNLRPLPTQTF